MENYSGKKYSCEFVINGSKLFGEISFDGINTRAQIWSSERIEIDCVSNNIYGLIYDEMKYITLIDSIFLSENSISTARKGDKYVRRYNCTIHPRFIAIGASWLENTKNVDKVWFSTDKLNKIFYDHNACINVIHVDEGLVNDLIKRDLDISHAKYGFNYNIDEHSVSEYHEIGTPPSIYVYAGSREILSFKNSFGEFSLYHIEDQRSYGANGITTNVSTQFCISLYETYSVDKIVRECWSVKNFFKILSGQDDCISKLLIKKEGDVEAGYFEIYLSTDTVEHSDLYFDSLLNAKMEKSVLNNIFQNWFDKHDEWKDARNQLCHTYSSNNYDVDRVVRCANIFDLIPDKAMIELSEDLIEAKNKAKKIFRELPDSLEKTSLLQALGRLGIKTLKHKINDRIEIILSNCKIKFDGLQFVAHQAVDCRNYFVHGGNKKFDYESNLNMVNFLTDTLEFIFVVSDLIECGWDIDDWLKSFALSHKVGQYCIAYPHYLTELNSIISNSSS